MHCVFYLSFTGNSVVRHGPQIFAVHGKMFYRFCFLCRFLFEAVHGKMFSVSKWQRFLRSRVLSDAPISFAEIEVELCDLPTPDDWEVDGNITNTD